MKILAIPRKNDKKYSFNLFELFRNYKNEVVAFWGLNTLQESKFFPIATHVKEFSILENKLDKILDDSTFDFLWNLGVNQEYLPYISQKAKKNKIFLIQTISDDAISYNKRNSISQAIFPEISYFSINKVLKFYSKDIDLFISHSDFLKEILIKEGIPEEKIVNIPMFVDAQKYIPYYKSEDYFVYRFSPSDVADLKFLLKAMEEMPQHKLIIIADEKMSAEIKILADNYNLHNVLWVKNLNSAQNQDIVKLSRFSIIFSDINPQKILESYARGKPVLALDSGANREYVVNTYSGLLFKKNQEDVIKKIDYLMTNKNFCEDSGGFARNLAENCFDKQNHYRQIFNALNVLSQRKSPQLKKIELLNIS